MRNRDEQPLRASCHNSTEHKRWVLWGFAARVMLFHLIPHVYTAGNIVTWIDWTALLTAAFDKSLEVNRGAQQWRDVHFVTCSKLDHQIFFTAHVFIDSFCGLVVRVPGYGTEISCFLWGTNWIYICYVEESRPRLSSSGQSFWLQIQTSWFNSMRYHIFWEIVGLEWVPLVSTTEELLGRKCSGSGLGSRECGRRNPSRWPRVTFYPQKWELLRRQTAVARSV
jgi:hypothetical protein